MRPKSNKLLALTRNIRTTGKQVCESLSKSLRAEAFSEGQNNKAVPPGEQAPPGQHPLDRVAHQQFLKLIQKTILPFFPAGVVVFSEESIDEQGRMRPIILSGGQAGETSAQIQTYVIVDPLDRTVEAIRALTGFASLTVGSFVSGPLVSIVFCLFHHQVSHYYAITGQGAWLEFRDGRVQRIGPSSTVDLGRACLAAYIGKSRRLTRLATQEDLFTSRGSQSLFINASGCYGFCLVASSQVDAFIETVKGYAFHDLISGVHILEEAGGMVQYLDSGEPSGLPNLNFAGCKGSTEAYIAHLVNHWTPTDPAGANTKPTVFRVRRYPFIAAATTELGAQIAVALAESEAPSPFNYNLAICK